MSIPNPKLTEEENAAIGRHLEEHNIACPACHSTDLGGTESLFGLVRSHEAPVETCIIQQPVVLVVCASCGYVMLFSPTRVGLERFRSRD